MKKILLLVIGIIIGGTLGIKASTLIKSSQVIYKDNQTVDVALNNLLEELQEGKAKIASAITNKGIVTSSTDSYDIIASNIDSIITGNSNLRYDENTKYVQIKNEDNKWVNIYKTDKIPIETRTYLIQNGVANASFSLNRLDSPEAAALTPSLTNGNGYIQLSLSPRNTTYGNGCTYTTKVNLTYYSKIYLKMNHYYSFGYGYRTSDWLYIGEKNTSSIASKNISTTDEVGVTYELDVSDYEGIYEVGYYIENQSKYLTENTNPNIVQFIDMWLE